ncbi:MAG TPA: hypothetical protein VLF62_04375 [Candidatus Saccharimonadales bacterium]|nr:hypothetical protein [Candidatus Saccharimonadales bacterium]
MKIPLHRLRNCLLAVALLLALTAAPIGPSAAAQDNDSQAIAQGFNINGDKDDFIAGALVSTKKGDEKTVELANQENGARLAGVVSDRPLVALSNGTAQTQIVISGSVPVVVSDINGDVRAGDKITASPIAGVGMLASGSDQVVGTAQSDFVTTSAKTRTITDTSGKQHTVHLGRVPLLIGISFYQAPTSGYIPPFVQGLANNIAGRPVSLMRILVCSILLLLAFVSTAALLYTSIRSGLISIGRNPLAAGAIRRGLVQIGVAVVLILGLVLLASYIILTV